jgi:hypothetical protein
MLLTGLAVGYVAGSAAGRQRYEQLKVQAKRAMENPKVQGAASEVQHRATEMASKVTHAAADKVGRTSSEPAYSTTTPNAYATE